MLQLTDANYINIALHDIMTVHKAYHHFVGHRLYFKSVPLFSLAEWYHIIIHTTRELHVCILMSKNSVTDTSTKMLLIKCLSLV